MDGHHAKTCPNILLTSNREWANAFLAKLVERGMVDGYLKSATNRFGLVFAEMCRKGLMNWHQTGMNSEKKEVFETDCFGMFLFKKNGKIVSVRTEKPKT